MLNNANQKWITFFLYVSIVASVAVPHFIPIEGVEIYINGYIIFAVTVILFLFSGLYAKQAKETAKISHNNTMLLDQQRSYKSYEKAIERSQAIVEFTADGILTHANKKFCDIVGYRLSEIQNRHHRIFVHKDYANSNAYQKFWRNLAAGEYFQDEYQCFGKNNKEIWLQASYNPILDENGKVQKIVTSATDVTKQKQHNIYHTSQIQSLKTALVMVEYSPDGIILDANENFCTLLGYRLFEVKGQQHSVFFDKDSIFNLEYNDFWQALLSGQYMQGQYKYHGNDEKEIWLQSSYNPIFDMNGDVISIVEYAMDITDKVTTHNENNIIIQKAISTIEKLSNSILIRNNMLSQHNDQLSDTDTKLSENIKNALSEDVIHHISGVYQHAEENKEVMDQAIHAMEMLEKNAERINTIVNIVDTIASQTNLLALNASIEAAKAGDVGKNFSVVASEVHSLASQCFGAASDIKKVTTISNAQIADSVSLVRKSAMALMNIVQSVNDISNTISNMSYQAQVESLNIQDITKAIDDIDSIAEKKSYLFDENMVSAKHLSGALRNLLMLIEKMDRCENNQVNKKEKAI